MLVNWHEEYAKVMTFIIVFRKLLHNFFVSFRISFAFVIDEREKCETTKKNQNIASKNTFIFYEFKGKNLCKMCSMEEKIANESHTMDVMKFVISR